MPRSITISGSDLPTYQSELHDHLPDRRRSIDSMFLFPQQPDTRMTSRFLPAIVLVAAASFAAAGAQQQTTPPAQTPQAPAAPAGRDGAPVQGAEPDITLVATFDRNGNKRLEHAERTAARE